MRWVHKITQYNDEDDTDALCAGFLIVKDYFILTIVNN